MKNIIKEDIRHKNACFNDDFIKKLKDTFGEDKPRKVVKHKTSFGTIKVVKYDNIN